MLEKDTRQAFKLMTVKSNVLLVYKRKRSKEIWTFFLLPVAFHMNYLNLGTGVVIETRYRGKNCPKNYWFHLNSNPGTLETQHLDG